MPKKASKGVAGRRSIKVLVMLTTAGAHLADGFDYRCHTGAGGVKGEAARGVNNPTGVSSRQSRNGTAMRMAFLAKRG